MGNVLNDRHSMGDEQVSDIELLLKGFQEIKNLGLDRYIQRTHGFVAHNQLRIERERPSYRDALALPPLNS